MKAVAIAVAAVCTLFGPNTMAQQPTGTPVRMILGVPPGGSLDFTARVVAQRLQDELRRTVIVENRPGANMLIATKLVASSPPDGNTLLMASAGPMTTNPIFYANEPVDPVKNLTPISILITAPLVLLTSSTFPAKTVQELIEQARGKPGEINYAAGTTSFRIPIELFMEATGTKLTHVPYNGAAPALTAVVSGQVQMTVLDIGTSLSLIRAGKLKPLLALSEKRSEVLPDVPSAREAGLQTLEVDTWSAIFAPAGVPADVADRLHEAIQRALRTQDVKEKFGSIGQEPSFMTRAEFVARIDRDRGVVRKVIERASIKMD